MADLLNTLTLDGNAMNVLNDRIPKGDINVYYVNITAVSIPNNTETSWDIWTAPATGLLIASLSITYAVNATGFRSLIGKRSGGEIGTGMKVATSPTSVTRLSIPIVCRVTEEQKLQMVAQQTSGGALNVIGRFCNGIFIPDVVGGVVRHLKKLICYRPLNMRKAVA